MDPAVHLTEPAAGVRRGDGLRPGRGQHGALRRQRQHHLVAETWTWNGTTWTRLSPPAHPPALENASMAYDPGTGQLVLYGGDGKKGCVHGTWTWDGTTWTKLHPAARPSACASAAMAYDQATGQLVLFGGLNVVSGRARILGQTWIGTAPPGLSYPHRHTLPSATARRWPTTKPPAS